MRMDRFLTSKPLQLFVIEEGLDPEVVVHSKSLELLGQREVSEDHVMNLERNRSVFNQTKTRFVTTPVVQTGSPLQTSLALA